ncbi:MAG: SDR family oxidoreductase [Pseudomonadota bacterium]|nr:SDR family oxidoreductase [Pseudomonadota bacterium]
MTKSIAQPVNLDNCIALVTGGGSGIGRSLAIEIAKATPSENSGNAAIIIADIRFGAAQETAASLKKLGATAVAFECDISNEEDVARLAKKINSLFGKLNLLFNVAGVTLTNALHDTNANDIEWLFSVNVFGACNTLRHFIPLLKNAAASDQTAHIVNFSSGFGIAVPSMGPVQPSAYAGTKHALVGLSDAMRQELQPDGVGVSVVCSGPVDTNAWNSLSFRQERFGGPIERAIESKKDIGAWGLTAEETANFVLSGLCDGDFFILPLSDSGHIQMRDSLQARYNELNQALGKSSKS